MSQNPGDYFRKLQEQAQKRASGGFPGGPRNYFGGAFGIVLLGTGIVIANNALFNGNSFSLYTQLFFGLTDVSGWWSQSNQIYEDRWCTERDI